MSIIVICVCRLQPPSYWGNPIVISVTCFVAVLSVVCYVLAHYTDTVECRRLGTVPLCGLDGPFRYELIIFTGKRPGSGKRLLLVVGIYLLAYLCGDMLIIPLRTI